ncbi:30S ribosomal protein S6 [uncultured bacterium]|nr:30S ribosomal protein S6 [uncultured bacterium]
MKKQMYESAIIISATLDDDQIEAVVNKFKDFIENNDGVIHDLEKWGRKRLTYVIKKQRLGYYAIYRFEAPVTIVKELERLYRIDENIIRHLTIKLEKNAVEYFEDMRNKASQAEVIAAVDAELAVVEAAEEAEAVEVAETTDEVIEPVEKKEPAENE